VHPGPGVPAVAVAVRAVRGRGQALTVLAACRGRGGLRGDRGGLLRVVGPLHRGAAADRLLRHHRPDLGVRGRHLAGPAAGRDRPGPPRPGSPLARPWLRLVLGWAGLAVLVSTGALLEVQRMFPGWIALVPLTGAALVFLAGSTGSALGADRLLSSRPFAFLGEISYGLYLVHW